MRAMPVLSTIALGAGLALGACVNEPVYLPGPLFLEAGVDDGMGNLSEAKASLQLPINLETPDDAAARAMREAALGIMVPYVKVGDIEVSVEWEISNLDPMNPGLALIQLNGANEYFSYDPSTIVLSDDDEAPPTPGLDGDIPIHIPAGGSVKGLFREDQLREASIDLDQITRGNVNPFTATLTISKNALQFQPMTPPMPGVMDYVQTPIGDPIPREAFAELIRVDLVFKPDRHMTMDYTVRVRDVRGILNDKLLDCVNDAMCAGELATFNPMAYAVAAPTP